MHICRFNLKFIGLGYNSVGGAGYNFITFELYKCEKCGRFIFKNKQKYSSTIYFSLYQEKLDQVRAMGYSSLAELIGLVE